MSEFPAFTDEKGHSQVVNLMVMTDRQIMKQIGRNFIDGWIHPSLNSWKISRGNFHMNPECG